MAVLSSQGRKGFAKGVLDYITGLKLANLYSLEVGDTNIPAVEFYKKTGFKVFCSIPGRYSKKSEISNFDGKRFTGFLKNQNMAYQMEKPEAYKNYEVHKK